MTSRKKQIINLLSKTSIDSIYDLKEFHEKHNINKVYNKKFIGNYIQEKMMDLWIPIEERNVSDYRNSNINVSYFLRENLEFLLEVSDEGYVFNALGASDNWKLILETMLQMDIHKKHKEFNEFFRLVIIIVMSENNYSLDVIYNNYELFHKYLSIEEFYQYTIVDCKMIKDSFDNIDDNYFGY